MTRQVRGAAMVLLFLFMVPPVWGKQYFLYVPQPVTPEETKGTKDGILVRELEVQKGDTLYGISSKLSGHGMYYPQILLFNNIKNPNLIQVGDTLKVPVSKGRPAEEAGTDSIRKKKRSGRKQGKFHKHRAVSVVSTDSHTVDAKPVSGQLKELSLSELKHQDKGKKKRGASKQALVGERKQVRSEQGNLPPVSSARKKPAAAGAAGPVNQEQHPAAEDAATAQRLFERAIKAYRQDDCRTALDLFERFLSTYPASAQAADASLYKAECYLKLSSQ